MIYDLPTYLPAKTTRFTHPKVNTSDSDIRGRTLLCRVRALLQALITLDPPEKRILNPPRINPHFTVNHQSHLLQHSTSPISGIFLTRQPTNQPTNQPSPPPGFWDLHKFVLYIYPHYASPNEHFSPIQFNSPSFRTVSYLG